MTNNPRTRWRGETLAASALLMVAGLVSVPALAAPEHDALCDESREASLEIPATALASATEELLEDHLLKPRVQATVREIFSEEVGDVDEEAAADTDDPDSEPAVRSLSDGQPKPFKRQMYRRDI